MQESISPKQIFLRVLHLWWLPFCTACLGSVIGLIISLLIPAQYEAIAEINLAVDFSKIGMVTDIEQDQIIEMVGDICKSDAVLSEIVVDYPFMTEEEFKEISKLERRNVKWVLKVRHADAELASELVHAWQEISYQDIQFAYEHAVLVDSLSDYMNSLTDCFENSVIQPTGSNACDLLTTTELQNEMKKVAQKISEEQILSQGISPAISVSITNEEILPATQVNGSTAWLILAGGFLGFLPGIWGIQFINKRGA
jgi:uncharacterized protein involved in exopolysaccharide biosynthesis